MTGSNLVSAMAAERKRLEGLKSDVAERQSELGALDAYEVALNGKGATVKTGGRSPSRRAQILSIIKDCPGGIGRAGILDALGVRGDKSAENSVSTALANMKKKGDIDNKDGIYTAN